MTTMIAERSRVRVGGLWTLQIVIGGSPLIPIVLLTSTTVIAWLRRSGR